MTSPRPPALAMRLLEHSGASPALIGDLVEEYANGRTSWWFWKQTAVAALPLGVRGLRWLAVIRAAGLATAAAQYGSTYLAWGVVSLLGLANPPWLIWFLKCITSPLMTAAFVTASIGVVPSQKAFVAKGALVVVCCWASLLMFGNLLLDGRFTTWTFAMGLSGLLGGTAAYRFRRLPGLQSKTRPT